MPDWFLDKLVKDTGLQPSNFVFHGLIGACHKSDVAELNGIICNVSCYAYSQVYVNKNWHGIMYYAWQKEMHESRYKGGPYYWHLKDSNHGNGQIDNNFKTVITMRYNASKNQLSFWKNNKQMIGENIKRIRFYQGRDDSEGSAFYGQKIRKQVPNVKCPLYFENGVFTLDSGFTYYPMVSSVGCNCIKEGGVSIGYDCD